MGTTTGHLKIDLNSGINDTLSTQQSPPTPPCLVVANASTVSQPEDVTHAQVAVADESSGSKSEEGTSATLVVTNGSTGSESSVLSEADTETKTLRVVNVSTASSSVGDSSKEERDPSDSHCNQNEKPNATSVYLGIDDNELRIGRSPAPSRENTLFPTGIFVPDHDELLSAGSVVLQKNICMQSSRNPVFQGDSTSWYDVENGLRHDEFSPSSAGGSSSDEPLVSIDTRCRSVGYERHNDVAKAVNEHRADDRRDQPLATPTHYSHNETNLSEAVGNETNWYVNPAFAETPTTRQEQSVPRSQAPGCEEDHLPFNRAETNQKRACSAKCLKVCLPIAAITAGLGLLALIVALSLTPKLFSTKARVQMRVDDTFKDDMVNPSSETSLQYGDKFCYNVGDAMKDDMSMNNCSVTGLQKGSVIVDFEIRFMTTLKYTLPELEAHIIKSGIGNDPHTSFGLIQAFTDTIKIVFLETSDISSEDSESEATPGTFGCSEEGEYYLPLPYTYPLYCGEYQLCAEGKGTARVCEEGLEYGDSKGNTEAPCHQPSNFTYCGRKTTTFMEAETTTGIVTTSVSSNSINCSDIDPQILANSSSMYECQNNNPRFVPRYDTYPNNCSLFKWCDYAPQSFHCALGSVFILQNGPCGTKGIDDTFCEQMKRAEWCRSNYG